MKNNVSSYSEYQNQLENNETTAQELTTQSLQNLNQKTVDKNLKTDPDITRNEKSKQSVSVTHRINRFMPRSNPWYDIVENENEAMIISLYAKGMSIRDIANYMKNIHGVEMPHSSISTITDKVFPLIKEWQSRPLASLYPIVYLDGLRFKVRDAGKITSKVAYVALGINQYGIKEVLGLWINEGEGAKFWLHVLTELKNRGIEDIFFVCIDGLKGFADAIKTIFPLAEVQTCVVHQIRHTVMFIPQHDRRKFSIDLREIYSAPNEEAGMLAIKALEEKWPQYKVYLKSWETRWSDLAPFFQYPEPIRRIIYTTNMIESLNHQFRKVTKTTIVFPHDDSVIKILWLAQADIAQSRVMAIRNWGEVIAQLSILFPERAWF